jgi:hypothetical protein
VDFGSGSSFGIEIIVWTPFVEFIFCTYVAREITLHMQIMHLKSNCWSEDFAKKFVAPNG